MTDAIYDNANVYVLALHDTVAGTVGASIQLTSVTILASVLTITVVVRDDSGANRSDGFTLVVHGGIA